MSESPRWSRRERDLFRLGQLVGMICAGQSEFAVRSADGRPVLVWRGDESQVLLLEQFRSARELQAVLQEWREEEER